MERQPGPQVVDAAAVCSNAAELLKHAFNRAKANVPAVLFIDNVDAVAPAQRQGSSQVSTMISPCRNIA